MFIIADGHNRELRGARARKKRLWSDAEKRTICLQTRVPGVSVSQVARRYDANANLVFIWLKDPRFAPGKATIEEHAAVPGWQARSGNLAAPPAASKLRRSPQADHRIFMPGLGSPRQGGRGVPVMPPHGRGLTHADGRALDERAAAALCLMIAGSRRAAG